MISFSKIRSAIIKQGRRILKVEQLGAKTADEVSSFGDDSHPISNMTAIYADTMENGEPVIIGYINTNQEAAVGEKRMYSLDENGNVAFFIWLKNDGSFEIGGDSDNAVRYQPLDDSLQSQATDINVELEKIRLGIIAAGGTYAKTDISIDTSAAKIIEVKTL